MKKNSVKIIKTVISLVLSFININLAASLEPWTKTCGKITLVLFYGIGFVLCFLLTVYLLLQSKQRLKIHSLLWGIPLAAAYVLGCLMRRDGTALGSLSHLPVLLLQILCLAVLAGACIAPLLWGFLKPECWLTQMRSYFTCWYDAGNQAGSGTSADIAAQGHKDQSVSHLKNITQNIRPERPAWQTWLFSTVTILLCWLPVFLAYYPSVFAYDAEGQLYQVLAHDYSTHHPLLHTIFLGAFFRLGDVLPGSYPAGMAVHSIVQMLLMATVFGYTLARLAARNVPAVLRIMLLLFYALFPTNSVLALSTTKDVLFSALVLLCTLLVYEMADSSGNGLTRKGWSLYTFWTILLLLFRNNALYALLLTIPAACFLLRRNQLQKGASWRRYLACTVLALILSAAGSMALKTALHAQNGSPREMLSIPLQQMARTRVKAEETLSEDMRRELDQYLPAEWVFAAYNPYLADPVKSRAVIHNDPAGFIRTWIRLGLKHPQIYIDAFLDTSVGYWFPEDRTHAQIYGLGSESGFGYLSTDTRAMPAGFEIPQQSLLPKLRARMERIVSDNSYQNIPGVRILFAPAFYWWLLCLYMAVTIYRKQYLLLLPAVFPVCYYMTLLLSPAVLIRYMYPFVVTSPVLFCTLFRQPRHAASSVLTCSFSVKWRRVKYSCKHGTWLIARGNEFSACKAAERGDAAASLSEVGAADGNSGKLFGEI